MNKKSIFILFLIGVFIAALFNSPVFDLEKVEIRGNQLVAEEVLLDHMAGEIESYNLLRINLGSVQRSLLSHRGIKEVSVKRAFPSRLIVEVNEYSPAVYYKDDERNLYFVLSDTGHIMDKSNDPGPYNLPFISGFDFTISSEDTAPEKIRLLLQYLKRLSTDNLESISEIRNTDQGLVLYTLEGVLYRFGGLDNLDFCLALFPQLQYRINKDNLEVEYVDLRSQDKPVLKLR